MSKNINLTQGNPAKALLNFAIPILMGMVLQQLYSTIDSVIVGNYEGTHALGAVGTTFPITFMLVAVASGLANASAVIVGKSFGANEYHKINRIIRISLKYTIYLGIVCGVVLYVASPFLLNLIQASDAIYDNALIYLKVYSVGLVFAFCYNIMAGIFRALGDSKTPLIFLGVACIINIVLDIYFVAILQLGVFGVAVATAIAQGVSFILQLIMLTSRMKVFKPYEESAEFEDNYSKTVTKELVEVAIPSMLSSVTIGVTIFISQALVNIFGPDASGAFAIVNKIENFAMMPMINISIAMTAFSAQNMGAGKPERVKEGFRFSLKFCSIVAVIVGVLVFLMPEVLIGIFVSDANENTINIGISYLRFMMLSMVGMAVLFPIEGLLKGSGDVKITAVTSISGTIMKIVVSVLLIYVFPIGITGIWIGGCFSWMTQAGLLWLRYKTDKWQHAFLKLNKN